LVETLDLLLRGRLKLYQPRDGNRVSLDALLLADFAAAGRPRRILDLGCGNGVVALALALRFPAAAIVGVELQAPLAALARRNAELNDVRLDVVEGDLARPAALPLAPASFDLVVSNPPFYPTGRGARGARDVERHEVAVTVAEVAAAAARFAKVKAMISLVFPAERSAELLAALSEADLAPRVVRPVVSVAGEPARRVLVAAQKGYRGGLSLLWPLVIHRDDRRTYTDEAARILGEA
jgi:tRNA1(Val) A37 N6-methylase TrmN6